MSITTHTVNIDWQTPRSIYAEDGSPAGWPNTGSQYNPTIAAAAAISTGVVGYLPYYRWGFRGGSWPMAGIYFGDPSSACVRGVYVYHPTNESVPEAATILSVKFHGGFTDVCNGTAYLKNCNGISPDLIANDLVPSDFGAINACSTIASYYSSVANWPDIDLPVSIFDGRRTGRVQIGVTFVPVLPSATTYMSAHNYLANSGGGGYPNLITTYTLDLEVATSGATNKLGNRATVHGTLVKGGGVHCFCWFEWGLTTAYGHTTNSTQQETGESFAQTLKGLDPEATYHYRAAAEYRFDGQTIIFYGADATFTAMAYTGYPADPITRVTTLRHYANRMTGVYRLTAYLGGLSNLPELPFSTSKTPAGTTPLYPAQSPELAHYDDDGNFMGFY